MYFHHQNSHWNWLQFFFADTIFLACIFWTLVHLSQSKKSHCIQHFVHLAPQRGIGDLELCSYLFYTGPPFFFPPGSVASGRFDIDQLFWQWVADLCINSSCNKNIFTLQKTSRNSSEIFFLLKAVHEKNVIILWRVLNRFFLVHFQQTLTPSMGRMKKSNIAWTMWVPVPGSSLNLYHPVPTRSDFKKKRGANRGNRVILERKKLLLTKSCFLHDLCFSFFPPGEFGSKRSNSDSQKLRKIPAWTGFPTFMASGLWILSVQHIVTLKANTYGEWVTTLKTPCRRRTKNRVGLMIWMNLTGMMLLGVTKKLFRKAKQNSIRGTNELFFRGTCFFSFFLGGWNWLFFSPSCKTWTPSGWTSQGELGGTHRSITGTP